MVKKKIYLIISKFRHLFYAGSTFRHIFLFGGRKEMDPRVVYLSIIMKISIP